MKMYRKSGKYTTGYYILIGSKEARDAGFVNEDKTSKQLKKIIDPENKRIIIELQESIN